MFTAACPGCGARVAFRSLASVMAVCSYCQTTVLREGDNVRDIGRMSAVLADHSPLQIGTQGLYQHDAFQIIGRLQLRYADGFWNEWYLQFDDGSNGWLADGSGQFVLTRPQGQATDAPAFSALRPGYRYREFSATDIRSADCIGGQGELPFVVGTGWQAHVADFRNGSRFLTLDYSDGTPPMLYAGEALTLDDLQCQMLREQDAIAESAGALTETLSTLACPNCGGSISYAVNAATHLVCPSCHAEVQCAQDTLVVLRKHAELQTLQTSLQPGAEATIGDHRYTLIGLLKAEEVEDGQPTGETWVEYLLYCPGEGFLWLVESSKGWEIVEVLNVLPSPAGNQQVRYDNKLWQWQWTYQARVSYAAGAFNWRIHVGDQTTLNDYRHNTQTLTSEQSTAELTWSLAMPVSAAQLSSWFGAALKEPAKASPLQGQGDGLRLIYMTASVVLWLLNVPLILFGHGSLIITLIAQFILWLFARTG